MVLAQRGNAGEYCLARPALQSALALRLSRVGVAGHGGWDSADIPACDAPPPAAPPSPGTVSAKSLPPPVRLPNLLKTKLKHTFQQMYELCDVDGDGEVTINECLTLSEQIAEIAGAPFDRAQAIRAWQNMDKDQDGTVSVHEYIECQMRGIEPEQYETATTRMQGLVKDVASLRDRKKHAKILLCDAYRKAYGLCDANGDGDVSLEECVVLDKQMAEVEGRLEKWTEADARRAFRAMDANGNGGVSQAEFVRAKLKLVPEAAHEAHARALERTLRHVASLRERRRLARSTLIEQFRRAFALLDVDGDDEASMEECQALDAEIANVQAAWAREAEAWPGDQHAGGGGGGAAAAGAGAAIFDKEASRQAWLRMDANNEGSVSFYEYGCVAI